MSKQVTFSVERREGKGKGPARRVRRSGRVPGNIYGHGVEAIAVDADAREFDALASRISVENTLIDLIVGDEKPRPVLIREVQRHPFRRQVLHIDFFAIRAGEKINVSVPLHLIGTPSGVRNAGGVLQQNLHEIEIECLPSEIPSSFEADVSELEIGDVIHLSDVDTGGFPTEEAPDTTICVVQPPRVVVEEEEEAADELGDVDMEPEVITARGDDSAESGEGN
ncbi:MAG: 50S ribosomal protein L25 [Gemmatimonadota bacterium]|nr:50S ribosomal protein L25 [Gemmatimonadota bacterium]MDH3428132.1 50S ribosomal protein L25 [Gemmatimonadota bacterium]